MATAQIEVAALPCGPVLTLLRFSPPDLWKAPHLPASPPPDPSQCRGPRQPNPTQPAPASTPRQGLTFQALTQAPSGGD